MKKFCVFIFLLCASFFIASFGVNNTFALALNEREARVIASQCNVYVAPSFSSEKLSVNDEVFTLKHGDIVEIIGSENDFSLIKKEEVSGYVYKYYLTQNEGQTVYPVFNASVRKKTPIFDLDLAETGYFAEKNERIFLFDGFDDKKNDKKYDGFTSVQVVLDDGSLYAGFIKTQDIKPDGISHLLIVGISIIVAAVTIILSLVFIKKKKNK